MEVEPSAYTHIMYTMHLGEHIDTVGRQYARVDGGNPAPSRSITTVALLTHRTPNSPNSCFYRDALDAVRLLLRLAQLVHAYTIAQAAGMMRAHVQPQRLSSRPAPLQSSGQQTLVSD